MKYFEELREKARRAINLPPRYGPDLDLSSFVSEESSEEIFAPISVENAAAKYYQVDLKTYYEKSFPGIEVMEISEAYREYPELMWKLVPPDLDKYSAIAFLKGKGGMFIRVKEGSKVRNPISACFSISLSGLQAPHSVIYVERGAEVNIISGCAAIRERPALHVGITEIYVEEGGSVTYTAVHTWKPKVHVRPRNGILLREGAKYYEFYLNMSEAESLQSETRIRAERKARAEVNSILTCFGPYYIDVFSEVFLKGEESASEVLSKALCSKGGRIVTRSKIIGKGRGASGHVECDGMLLDRSSGISTIPELEAKGDEVSLTHEASIGKISDEEIFYLMTKGFEEKEAKSLIVRGFLQIDLSILPPQVREFLNSFLKKMSEGI